MVNIRSIVICQFPALCKIYKLVRYDYIAWMVFLIKGPDSIEPYNPLNTQFVHCEYVCLIIYHMWWQSMFLPVSGQKCNLHAVYLSDFNWSGWISVWKDEAVEASDVMQIMKESEEKVSKMLYNLVPQINGHPLLYCASF